MITQREIAAGAQGAIVLFFLVWVAGDIVKRRRLMADFCWMQDELTRDGIGWLVEWCNLRMKKHFSDGKGYIYISDELGMVVEIRRLDPVEGLELAKVVIEGMFPTPFVWAGLARPGKGGDVDVWAA